MHEIAIVNLVSWYLKNDKKNETRVACPACGMEVVHRLEGRVRLRSSFWEESEENIESALNLLDGKWGILTASGNSYTGTLLITFEEDKIGLDEIMGLLKEQLHGSERTSYAFSSRKHSLASRQQVGV